MKAVKKQFLVLILASLILSFSLSLIFILGEEGKAANVNIFNQLETFRTYSGFQNANDVNYRPLAIVGRVVNVLLGLLGVAAVVIIIIGGFKWMTAGGAEEKIKDAKKLIGQGIIGLVIVLAAYAIAWFILEQLANKFLNSPV
jgi:amino acid transporter